MSVSLSCEAVKRAIKENGFITFKQVHLHYREIDGEDRPLSLKDKRCITSAIQELRIESAAEDRLRSKDNTITVSSANRREAGSRNSSVSATQGINDPYTAMVLQDNIMIVMAYSNDYVAGRVCESVNRDYAAKHGYVFHSVVASSAEMESDIHPKTHCTWYKIKLLRDLLSDAHRAELTRQNVRYLVWIDADAVIVEHEKTLINLVEQVGAGRELVIGEDMHTGCLINAGVFALRVCAWSKRFLDKVWASSSYDNVFFYEQSAMIKCLKSSGEGMELVKPFHSFAQSKTTSHSSVVNVTAKATDDTLVIPPSTTSSSSSSNSLKSTTSAENIEPELQGTGSDVSAVKLFPHVAVLPQHRFNSNMGVTTDDIMKHWPLLQQLGFITLESLAAVTIADTAATSAVVGDTVAIDISSATVNSGEFSDHNDTIAATADEASKQSLAAAGSTGHLAAVLSASANTKSKFDLLDAEFIYHPAGKKYKLELIGTALMKYGVEFSASIAPNTASGLRS